MRRCTATFKNTLTFSETKVLHVQIKKNLSPCSTNYDKSVWSGRQIRSYPNRPQTDEFLLSVRKLNHCHPTRHYIVLFFPQSLSLHVPKLTLYSVSVRARVREGNNKKRKSHSHTSVWAVNVYMSLSMCLSLQCVCVCVCETV